MGPDLQYALVSTVDHGALIVATERMGDLRSYFGDMDVVAALSGTYMCDRCPLIDQSSQHADWYTLYTPFLQCRNPGSTAGRLSFGLRYLAVWDRLGAFRACTRF